MPTIDLKSPTTRVAIVAVAVAIVAVLVAAGAVVAAFMALSRVETPSNAAPQPAATGGGVDGASSAAPPPVDGPTEEPSPVQPVPDFELSYEKVSLKIPASRWCSGSVDIDIDGPAIDSGSADFTRVRCAGPDEFEFGEVSVSQDATPKIGPAECMEKLDLAPMREGAQLPIPSLHVGDALCILTNRETAIGLGLPQRIALLEVKGFDDDGTIAVVMTAWNVPD
ncbi:hypothetical protein AB0M36_05150 [Actinoplanes sp. NPDC051346]|uniref:hypothetical protein n=1 Tax=Actinoplanes sp. NPDC051346 TaxID=3155048 RepID=UPI00342257AA